MESIKIVMHLGKDIIIVIIHNIKYPYCNNIRTELLTTMIDFYGESKHILDVVCVGAMMKAYIINEALLLYSKALKSNDKQNILDILALNTCIKLSEFEYYGLKIINSIQL